MKITFKEIEEYRNLSELVVNSLKRMKEIDAKIPRNTLGGGNYKSESFIKNMEINESINKIIRP